jgi:amino acid transporter
MNGSIFTGARTNYAVGHDFSIFTFLGRWSEKTNTATNALLFQGVISLLLVLMGTLTRKGFETMVAYTAPIFWLFFLLTGISLFILRFREPLADRPFRVPLYPLTPILFCAAAAYMLRASLLYAGIGATLGVAVFLLGGLLLLVMHYREKAR